MEVRSRLTAREGRRFAFTVGVAFLVLGALMLWRGHGILQMIFWGIGGVLVAAGIVVPGRLTRVQRAWMGLGHAMSRITSPIVMGAVFYLVLSPIGVLLRIVGRNPLKPAERDGGFWMPAKSGDADALENQF